MTSSIGTFSITIQNRDTQHNGTQYCYTECLAERHIGCVANKPAMLCRYAECHYAYRYAECRYAECHYAYRYAECRYAECRGALGVLLIDKHFQNLQIFKTFLWFAWICIT
jgi:hypothetical protein